jgi:hypothetical protein
MKVVDTGAPISMPVGSATLGRVMNVLGEPVRLPDRPINAKEHWSIHRKAPSLEDQSTELQMFETDQGRRPARAATCAAARSGCSAAPASARRSSSRS